MSDISEKHLAAARELLFAEQGHASTCGEGCDCSDCLANVRNKAEILAKHLPAHAEPDIDILLEKWEEVYDAFTSPFYSVDKPMDATKVMRQCIDELKATKTRVKERQGAVWVKCNYGCGVDVCVNPSDPNARQAAWNHICLNKLADLRRQMDNAAQPVTAAQSLTPVEAKPGAGQAGSADTDAAKNAIRIVASAMRKVLPPLLLQEVIDHCDPLSAFLRDGFKVPINHPSASPSAEPKAAPDGWIACEERLPDDGQTVLALRTQGNYALDVKVCEYEVEGGTHTRTRFRVQGTLHELDRVTHWRPLPEPPRWPPRRRNEIIYGND